MENASKALMIAGEVLIGVILLTVLVYAFRTGGQFAETTDDSIEDISISKFNLRFTVYSGRTNVTWHELVSLINLIKEINDNGVDSITISIDSVKYTSVDLNKLKTELEGQDKEYKCIDIQYNLDTNKVNYIEFRKDN